jgi:hypothetical protein
MLWFATLCRAEGMEFGFFVPSLVGVFVGGYVALSLSVTVRHEGYKGKKVPLAMPTGTERK